MTSTPSGALARAVKNGRIKQSIVHWCFEFFGEKWTIEQTCQVAQELGCKSVELMDPKLYPTLKQYGLAYAMVPIDMNPDPPFVKGWNNPTHWPRLLKATREAIDAAVACGSPTVITFTGYSARNPADPKRPHPSLGEAATNCVDGLKQIVGYAEQHKVT